MDKEEVRLSFNKFLRMYFDACNDVYEEIHFDRIKGSRFKYLKEIHKRGKTTLTELAEHFDLSKPTVTEVINVFESNGFIEKAKSSEDKRVYYISLTEMGRTLATTNILESKRAVDKMFDVLSKKEMKFLIKIFNKFGGDPT
ncbi:MarR family winged helix-turn-helix transcriptional regulator [Candidatus Xianfuyuplasma coldseepsis]|uniref:Winged helix-turn-helix transcriptional regulator n=1 Tax=Candidatus Xianfuyuplasma coldseepsis TaxID=2782163 RepID=A0A7L7KT30_9MOLU|nr:MarR family winged helix-turn-helix transcriptional regulator [Xianfuyuplasma coldseepsis]QMS85971.1 winged helix-turn-helix transcriptional regulator [Xianfuyuplasma coldseepsis]